MKTFHRTVLLVLLGACSSAFAQWQWLDNDGRKVFSDRPPPQDLPEKNIVKRPPIVAKSEAASDSGNSAATVGSGPTEKAPSAPGAGDAARTLPVNAQDKELQARKKRAEQEEEARKSAEKMRVEKARADNCVRARQALSTYSSGGRIASTNANGERVFLDEAAVAAERAHAQAIVNSDCN